MTERPILFSGAMVRAILEGRKTQTRRIVKPVRGWEKHNICKPDMAFYPWTVWWHGPETDRVGVQQECPHGKPGDRLWVKETWRTLAMFDHLPPTGIPGDSKPIRYEADGGINGPTPYPYGKTRVSIHMPRWASRITLELTDVRVERLNDISADDAAKEGIRYEDGSYEMTWFTPAARDAQRVSDFRKLWESINGADSWSANPWVWVESFKVVKP